MTDTSAFRHCTVALLCALGLSVAAQPYVEIRALIDLKSWDGRATNGEADAKSRTISIRCITGTNEWRIEHDWLLGGEVYWFYDGTNVYESLRPKKPVPEEMERKVREVTKFATVPFEEARTNLTINVWSGRNGLAMADSAANLSWLVFCSGPYLQHRGRLIPLPLDDFHHTRDRFAYTDKTEIFSDGLGLPRRVELFTSRSLFLESETGFDREYFFEDRYTKWVKKTAETLPEGLLTFRYQVLETTNLMGWTFPARFEFFQKGRPYEQNGDWYYRGTGTLTSIHPCAKPQSLFDPTMQQTVVDWRFRDETNQVDALIYTTTNGFAGPVSDPGLQEKFHARVEQTVSARRRKRSTSD